MKFDLRGLVNKGTNWVVKNSPAILTGVGVIGLGATAYLTYKARPKVEAAIEKAEMETAANASVHMDNETKVGLVKDVAGALAVPVLVGGVSIYCLFTSWKIQNNRIAALSGALTLITKEVKSYRERYAKKHGENEAKEFFSGVRQEKQTYIDEKGKEKVKTAKVKDDLNTLHGVWFSKSDMFASDDIDLNCFTIDEMISKIDIMSFKGQVTLNDVYEVLQIPTTRQGAVLGWKYDDCLTMSYDVYPELGENGDIYITWTEPTYLY